MEDKEELMKVDFEVYGRVQGVFFRKVILSPFSNLCPAVSLLTLHEEESQLQYIQEESRRLGLRGNCRNTSAGTVSGTLQGPRPQINRMKAWLGSTGSPMSRIDKVKFRNEESMQTYTLNGTFGIMRST